MIFSPLPRDFYSPAADVVAPALLGHFLLRKVENEWLGGEIVETEAYLVNDPACHAYVRQTPRNAVMWGDFGFAYVFRIYGGYFCVNAVTRPAGFAEAVLIRAIEPRFGLESMKRLREGKKEVDLTNGPSKLCIALDIDRAQNGQDLTAPDSDLIIARNDECADFLKRRGAIVRTSRTRTFARDRLAAALVFGRLEIGVAARNRTRRAVGQAGECDRSDGSVNWRQFGFTRLVSCFSIAPLLWFRLAHWFLFRPQSGRLRRVSSCLASTPNRSRARMVGALCEAAPN